MLLIIQQETAKKRMQMRTPPSIRRNSVPIRIFHSSSRMFLDNHSHLILGPRPPTSPRPSSSPTPRRRRMLTCPTRPHPSPHEVFPLPNKTLRGPLPLAHYEGYTKLDIKLVLATFPWSVREVVRTVVRKMARMMTKRKNPGHLWHKLCPTIILSTCLHLSFPSPTRRTSC